ncbi:MAG: hypothetical protein US96_C0021G0011 [Candidatus Woesebacteria bacterium GW2011_GWB1_38_5b]|uniref:Uncharacterized protein n=1 Tax=Candidatus Woesebacteria bacterium GW2011_GWB1_38_5b TaxID=1618569 RepID=A0A0G0MML7_9BACT|nr:MAG: hypothetical protein US96_C0021G0011 [Candidatus Woesebacteria bacterium GW2011_GWB1_38_5b]
MSDNPELVDQTTRKDAEDNTPILVEADEIVKLENEEERSERIRQFIQKRKIEIENDSHQGELSFLNKSTKSFLGRDTRIVANFLVDPLIMDDDEIYIAFFDTLREFRTHSGWKDQNVRNILPHVFQRSIGKYFGGQRAYEGSEGKRKSIYFENTHSKSNGVSVREFKDQGAAFCAEKASMAHNLYLFLGYDAELIISNNYEIQGENEDNHMFNKLNINGKTVLYDPSNPYEVTDDVGNIINYYPAIYSLTPEQSDLFEKGTKVEVKRPEMRQGEDGRLIQASEEIWAYGRHS